MITRMRPRTLIALLAMLVLALGVAACGKSDDEGGADTRANLIKENPANHDVRITVGSKNFTEQYILGEIYAQALEAAGYDVKKRLDLGPERVALEALEDGEDRCLPRVHLDRADLVLRLFRPRRAGRRPEGVPATPRPTSRAPPDGVPADAVLERQRASVC